MKTLRYRMLSLLLTFFLVLGIFQIIPAKSAHAAAESTFQIDFIDVGQGDAALIQCDGHYMLIDGGDSPKSSLIYSYLKQRSVSYLDVMVATHSHMDHIGGLSGALSFAKVGTVYCPVTESDSDAFRNFINQLAAQDKTITIPSVGDTFDLGSAQVTILAPAKVISDDNNSSIVLRIVYGNTSFLFVGDAESEEENALVKSNISLKSTVLKVGHHGSETSTGYRFLRKISPQYAVISVGEENIFGEPTEEVLSRLRDANVKTYRTDMQGDIICTSDGNTVTFTPEKNADADTLAAPADKSIPSPDSSSGEVPSASDQETTPQEQTYVLNTNTHKFHYPTCKSAAKIKDKNKTVYTGSRDDIISQGYDPCKNCNP